MSGNEKIKQLAALFKEVGNIELEEDQVLDFLKNIQSVSNLQKLADEALDHAYKTVEENLREKIKFIQEQSDQVCVVTGPSGSGKGMIIELLKEEYGFVETPFITSRDLREGEEEDGSRQVSSEEFLSMEGTGKLFLAVSAYGNFYGYSIDLITDLLKQQKMIVVEAPPDRILTEIDFLLPKAVTLTIIPNSSNFTKKSLAKRNSENTAKQIIRRAQGEADKAQSEYILGFSNVYPIIPIYGEPEHARQQVRNIFEGKLGPDHKLCQKKEV